MSRRRNYQEDNDEEYDYNPQEELSRMFDEDTDPDEMSGESVWGDD